MLSALSIPVRELGPQEGRVSLRAQDTSPGAQGQQGWEKAAFTLGRSAQGSAQQGGQEGPVWDQGGRGRKWL